jgi:hypothetical protein
MYGLKPVPFTQTEANGKVLRPTRYDESWLN